MDIYGKDKTTLEKALFVLIESKAFAFLVIGIIVAIIAVFSLGQETATLSTGNPAVDDILAAVGRTTAQVLFIVIIGSSIFVCAL